MSAMLGLAIEAQGRSSVQSQRGVGRHTDNSRYRTAEFLTALSEPQRNRSRAAYEQAFVLGAQAAGQAIGVASTPTILVGTVDKNGVVIVQD